ncbi:MAG: HAD-IA family hydrolase [Chitinispirillaceae bacterium]|nr:HAD-IA family hydrolase [Chitinispirillaceae bacterium]
MKSTSDRITLIFDFDGTVADTMEMLGRIYNRIAPEYNCRPIADELREVLRKGRPQDLIKEYGMPPLKMPVVVLRMRKEVSGCIAQVKPIRGIAAALRELKSAGYTLGIISSNAPENVRTFLAVNDLCGLFDFIQSSKHVFGKAAVIKRLMRKRGISSRQTIYIGDETRDIEAARKASIPVVAVSWGYQAREILQSLQPDRIADDPKELIGCIQRIDGKPRVSH